MKVGVPKEIKNREFRVAMVPEGVRSLVAAGHQVFIEKNAGIGSGVTDKQYKEAGAVILDKAEEVWGESEMVIKVKEPLSEEIKYFRKDLILFTYLHLAAVPELANRLIEQQVTAISYETIQVSPNSSIWEGTVDKK